MAKWVFPVEIDLPDDMVPATAGEAQKICAQIESALAFDLNIMDRAVICMQPLEGVHKRTSVVPA